MSACFRACTSTQASSLCSEVCLRAFEHAQAHKHQASAVECVLRVFKHAQAHMHQTSAVECVRVSLSMGVCLRAFEHAQAHTQQATALACVQAWLVLRADLGMYLCVPCTL